MDRTKDQSYYLSSVSEDRLRQSIFPLGAMLKQDVRALARRHALPTAERDESMGICFIGERGKFSTFLGAYGERFFLTTDDYVEGSEGEIVSPEGTALGRHNGLHHYTIGQRARIGGLLERFFVAHKDVIGNRLVIAPGDTHPLLQCTALSTSTFHWIPEDGAACLHGATQLAAQVRSQAGAAPCRAEPVNGAVRVVFDDPVTAVSPGQVVALYDRDVCLGSGEILHTETVGVPPTPRDERIAGAASAT